jgi:DNA ligase (NAD+)
VLTSLTSEKIVLDKNLKISYNMCSISMKGSNMTEIVPPTECPSCEAALEWSNDLLYCRNTDCFSQSSRKIEHFAKTLKIKGLGPASIQKLELSDFADIYTLTKMMIAEALASEKVAEKLFFEIRNSVNASLNLLLPALGIPLVGKTASAKLSSICKNIYDVNYESCQKAGLGPKATQSLLNWVENEYPFCELPHSFKFNQPTAQPSVQGVVCISGRLKSFKTKAAAAEALSEQGYLVKSSITRDVTHLVNESGIESVKTQRARDSGIIVITHLKDLIGETHGIA